MQKTLVRPDEGRPGKLKVTPTEPTKTAEDVSPAHSAGTEPRCKNARDACGHHPGRRAISTNT